MNTQIQAFLEQVQRDEALQAQVLGSGGETAQQTRRSVVQIAAEAGYRFTEADLDAAVAASAPEVNDGQLDQVAGGVRIQGMPATGNFLEQQDLYRTFFTSIANGGGGIFNDGGT